jgi:hypothetical protein
MGVNSPRTYLASSLHPTLASSYVSNSGSDAFLLLPRQDEASGHYPTQLPAPSTKKWRWRSRSMIRVDFGMPMPQNGFYQRISANLLTSPTPCAIRPNATLHFFLQYNPERRYYPTRIPHVQTSIRPLLRTRTQCACADAKMTLLCRPSFGSPFTLFTPLTITMIAVQHLAPLSPTCAASLPPLSPCPSHCLTTIFAHQRKLLTPSPSITIDHVPYAVFRSPSISTSIWNRTVAHLRPE